MTIMRAADVDWRLYRDVRLRALTQDPDAFGSTLARAHSFDDATWIERASNPGTFLWLTTTPAAPRTARPEGHERAAAPHDHETTRHDVTRRRDRSDTAGTPSDDGTVDDVRADGLIGLLPAALYLNHPEADQVRETFGADAAHLAFVIQMWVDPARRGSGVFDALMDAVIAEARARNVRVIALHVYRNNARAAAAYRRRGFALTSSSSPQCPPDEAEYVLRLD